MLRLFRIIALMFGLTILVAACGNDDNAGGDGTGTDSGTHDGGTFDATAHDAGSGVDATIADTGTTDTGLADAGHDAADATAATYAVGGTVTGLVGTGLVLQDNAGDNLAVTANGAFAFAKHLASGAAYAVTVLTQPTGPAQTCVVAAGTGTVASAAVTSVAITCSTTKYTVGGTVTGLTGTGLVLQNNGADPLTITANGAFTFATAIASGATYAVTIKTQPSSPAQSCTVTGGSGTVGTGNVTGVVVNCATNTFTVGGTIAGLKGTAVLQNNGGNDLSLNANGTFAFSTPIASGAAYAVTVKTQPGSPSQTCTVAGGTGTVASSNVTSVVVTCVVNAFTIGGSISGLGTGATVVLQDNGGDNLSVKANGTFVFATSVASGAAYAVTILTQPTSPAQTCTLATASGVVAAANVTNVAITCVTNKYTVGGTLSGLAAGASITLQDNGGDDKTLTADGAFIFTTSIASGGSYAVTVKTQPSSPVQTCVVSAGTGTIGSGNVTGVVVNCATNAFTVGGTVSGLAGTVVLQDNGGNDLTLNANGGFAFSSPVQSGSTYLVTVKTQPDAPTSQTCSVTSGSGTITTANVTDVTVSCVTNKFTVGGMLSGLAGGASVEIQDNGGDNVVLTANGGFSFATPVASGAGYTVTVLNQPAAPAQTCVVTNGGGNVGDGNVTNVTIACTTNVYAVGGSVSGLVGSGFVLQDNAGDNLPVTANGSFVFATKVASGGAYAVTILTQPSAPAQSCTVSAGTGTVTNGDVTGVTVNCSTNTYTIGGTLSGLAGGATVVLQDNATNDLTLTTNGAFAFSAPIASGAAYAVTVKTQPGSPSQVCTVTGGTGNVGASNVTTVAVTCVTQSYSVGGTVTGLASAGTLVLRNNGGNDLSLTASGAFAFTTLIASNNPYAVTIATQPTGAYCTLTNGTGTVTTANITSVAVACTVAAGANCTAIKTATPSSTDGTYVINPSGTSSFPAYCDMTTGQGGWTQVYDQDVRIAPGYRPNATWAAGVNPTQPNSGQYSILNILDQLKGGAARFQFRIDWPEGPNLGSVEWQQVENPLSLSGAPTVTSLVESPANQVGCGAFGGLSLSSSGQCLLDGEPTSGCYWWAIGENAAYNGGIPAYATVNQGSPRARMWMRTPTPASCADVKAANPSATSGTYTIDVDGTGAIAPISAYCDMTYNDGTATGGWTLIEVIQPPNGPTSGLVQGTPAPGGSTYLPLATMQALANASTQVHIRTPGLASTQSVTSIANGPPIVHLRTGNMVDVLGDATNEHTLWTGPFADAGHLDFTCANYSTAWPSVYQACGTNGMHIWLQHSRWNWSGGNAALNTAFEIYLR